MPGGMALPPNGAQGAGGAWGGGLFPDWFEAAAREHRWDSITAANFFRNWVASGPLGPDGEPLDLGWYWNTFLPVDPATQQPGVNYNAPQFTDNPNGHLYNGEEPGWGAADRSRQPQVPPPAHQQQQNPPPPPGGQPPPPPPPPGGNPPPGAQQQSGGPRGVQVRNWQDLQNLRMNRLNSWRQSRGLSGTSQNQYGQSVVNAPAPTTQPPGQPPVPGTTNAPNSQRPPGTPGPWGGSQPVPTNTTPNPGVALSNTNGTRPAGTPGPWGGSKPVGAPTTTNTTPPGQPPASSLSNSTRRRYGGLLA